MPTVSEIAKRAGVPNHKVVYLIRRKGIRPTSYAGAVQVFEEADAERLVAELRRIAEFRSTGQFASSQVAAG